MEKRLQQLDLKHVGVSESKNFCTTYLTVYWNSTESEKVELYPTKQGGRLILCLTDECADPGGIPYEKDWDAHRKF